MVPKLTITEALQARVAVQRIENAQLKARIAQMELEQAQAEAAALFQKLQRPGYELDPFRLVYVAKPPAKEGQDTKKP